MNKLIYILILIIGLLTVAFIVDSGYSSKNREAEVYWVDDLPGDFEFRKVWTYPEGVYRNKFGQLSCDGFCPEGTEAMKDSVGKIHGDSLDRFYQLLDTTHQYHSISCKAWCYEWAGTDFISVKQTGEKQMVCSTHTNVGTHCKLILKIDKNICIPVIELNSISAPELKTYDCKDGFIKIDKESWTNGILKAKFDFVFDNTDEPSRNMFWKGEIYQTIEK